MKLLRMRTLSWNQVKALLRKDVLVRCRQPWMTVVQFVWPCVILMLLFLIQLKYGPKAKPDCQFPARLLPTKNNVLAGFYSYICTLENKCLNASHYEELSNFDNAPMKHIVDIVQIFLNDDTLFNTIIDLPKKGNFLSAVTNIVVSSHMEEIKKNVEKVGDLIPKMEKYMTGGFDIKKMFSDRRTFVKAGYLLCGQPFPNTESIPLINEILESEDFSDVNDDELKVMPTAYCKKLYRDVTSTNQGKITWNTIKPIIHGKILYAPHNEGTHSIIGYANDTFAELNRLKMFSAAVAELLTKIRTDTELQASFERLMVQARSPIARMLLGNSIDIEQIETMLENIRSNAMVYDTVQTIKNILECLSVDRFVSVDMPENLRKIAYDLNSQRLFYGAVHFEAISGPRVEYTIHMDTDNTQPTIETRNRFWFPGPSADMLMDMKYHRGFVQIKQSIDMGIVKHKKQTLRDLGLLGNGTTTTTSTPRTSIKLSISHSTDDDYDDEEDNESSISVNHHQTGDANLSSAQGATAAAATEAEAAQQQQPPQSDDGVQHRNATDDKEAVARPRKKRQALWDFLLNTNGDDPNGAFNIDDMRFYTKQFPYPAYVDDDFKTGIYLAQAVQVTLLLGLIAQIASCVRHRVWMRESRNSMIMRSMGLKSYAETMAWTVTTFVELLIIFLLLCLILYSGGLLVHTGWLVTLAFLLVFGISLIAYCYMCSTFFASATIGAVATVLIFFISLCPYIIVLLFDAELNGLQSFGINLSLTTAFAYAWNYMMRVELQQTGLLYKDLVEQGLSNDFLFGIVMLLLDAIIYTIIGYMNQRYKSDEFRFMAVCHETLDTKVGATLENVTKIYDENRMALENVSIVIPRNRVTTLLGRNGAGKSTIIKLLTGQICQTSGRVVVSQTMCTDKERNRVGLCMQDNILIPTLTAREHLELYAQIKLRHRCNAEVEKMLKSLNFGAYENYRAMELSGGYQRRLCVGIAFIGSPNLVILDEPCNGVDTKARRDIWELIGRLRTSRAVLVATHFLDEAELLSDTIVLMKNGRTVAQHHLSCVDDHSVKKFHVSFQCLDGRMSADIVRQASEHLSNYKFVQGGCPTTMRIEMICTQGTFDHPDFVAYLEEHQRQGAIRELCVESEGLEQIFNQLEDEPDAWSSEVVDEIDLRSDGGGGGGGATDKGGSDMTLTRWQIARELLWKRCVHFSRNYRMLLYVLVLPAIFEILAMWFVAYRREDDYDRTITFDRQLYAGAVQALSVDQPGDFVQQLYGSLKAECADKIACKEFTDSAQTYRWILRTADEYRENRYGAYAFNQSSAIVWYNNKGYHAMMAWLNDLNTHILRTELSDADYSITSHNAPWKISVRELSTTSILRQAGDSAMVFILLIAFCLIVAVAAVYLVNERVGGEKLQQRLSGVDLLTYWGVACVWDLLILTLCVLICAVIMLCFGMPVFVDRQQLGGIIVLGLVFGFACIPAIHVIEKYFHDASVAIVTIFCMNIIIPLFTMSLVILLGVIGDTPAWDDVRHFLNRAFLVFPQHALGDGLLEICKTYMVAQVFRRFDIDSYKNPLNSDLLRAHFISLVVMGVLFMLFNILLESGRWHHWRRTLWRRPSLLLLADKDRRPLEELKVIRIENSLQTNGKTPPSRAAECLNVENLYKAYGRGKYAVQDVTFSVKSGECFGLLGKNGAGKSTIFKMLSGQMEPTAGNINYFNHRISYCPQAIALDPLLTVSECLQFYGRLRCLGDLKKVAFGILKAFQMETYRDELVRNLSGGNRRKLTVATSCLGRTDVVLMDEPTSDMDPVTRAIVYRVIGSFIAQRRAVVLTSHSIAEIETICHRIGLLKDGQMLICSNLQDLRSQYGEFYNVTIFYDANETTNVETRIRQCFPSCHELQIYSHSIKFYVKVASPSTAAVPTQEENAIDAVESGVESTANHCTITQLVRSLNDLAQQLSARYTLNRCRLDTMLERIVASNETKSTTASQSNGIGVLVASMDAEGHNGYIHNGFVETETAGK